MKFVLFCFVFWIGIECFDHSGWNETELTTLVWTAWRLEYYDLKLPPNSQDYILSLKLAPVQVGKHWNVYQVGIKWIGNQPKWDLKKPVKVIPIFCSLNMLMIKELQVIHGRRKLLYHSPSKFPMSGDIVLASSSESKLWEALCRGFSRRIDSPPLATKEGFFFVQCHRPPRLCIWNHRGFKYLSPLYSQKNIARSSSLLSISF